MGDTVAVLIQTNGRALTAAELLQQMREHGTCVTVSWTDVEQGWTVKWFNDPFESEGVDIDVTVAIQKAVQDMETEG